MLFFNNSKRPVLACLKLLSSMLASALRLKGRNQTCACFCSSLTLLFLQQCEQPVALSSILQQSAAAGMFNAG